MDLLKKLELISLNQQTWIDEAENLLKKAPDAVLEQERFNLDVCSLN